MITTIVGMATARRNKNPLCGSISTSMYHSILGHRPPVMVRTYLLVVAISIPSLG
jgi:hypothetical protein